MKVSVSDPPMIYLAWKKLHDFVVILLLLGFVWYLSTVWNSTEGARRTLNIIFLAIFLAPVTAAITVTVRKSTTTVDEGGNKLLALVTDMFLVVAGLVIFQESVDPESSLATADTFILLGLLVLFPLLSSLVLFGSGGTKEYLLQQSIPR